MPLMVGRVLRPTCVPGSSAQNCPGIPLEEKDDLQGVGVERLPDPGCLCVSLLVVLRGWVLSGGPPRIPQLFQPFKYLAFSAAA